MKTYYETIDDSYSPGKDFSMLNRHRLKGKRRRFTFKKKKRAAPGTSSKLSGDRWKCHICGIAMAERSSLLTHLNYTHSDLAYQCVLCGKAFSRPSNLRKHITQSHPDVDHLDPGLCNVVNRNDLPEEQQRIMKRLSAISKKRKIYITSKLVLPTITAFNCHDCDSSFGLMADLFQHCKLQHRISETGQPYPHLVATVPLPKPIRELE